MSITLEYNDTIVTIGDTEVGEIYSRGLVSQQTVFNTDSNGIVVYDHGSEFIEFDLNLEGLTTSEKDAVDNFLRVTVLKRGREWILKDSLDRKYIVRFNTEKLDIIMQAGGTRWNLLMPLRMTPRIFNPILHLPLEDDLTVSAGVGQIAFTRATTGTYISDGALKTAEINEARFEKDGLLMEGASTNHLLYSEQFDSAAWGKVNTTVVPDVIMAPYGAMTGDKLVETAVTSNHHCYQTLTGTGLQVAASMFIYRHSTKTTAAIDLYNATDGQFARADIDVPTGVVTLISGEYAHAEKCGDWWRVSLAGTATATVNTIRVFMGGFTAYLGDGVSWLGVWGAQLEDRPYESSYIPTTAAAATRTADKCLIQFAGNHPSIQVGNPFTYLVDAVARDVDAPERNVLNAGFGDPGVNSYSLIRSNNLTQGLRYFRSASDSFTGADLGKKMRYGVTVDSDQLVTLFVDGDAVLAPTKRTLALNTGVNATNIGIGCKTNGTLELFGHVKNIRIYGVALLPTEMRLA